RRAGTAADLDLRETGRSVDDEVARAEIECDGRKPRDRHVYRALGGKAAFGFGERGCDGERSEADDERTDKTTHGSTARVGLPDPMRDRRARFSRCDEARERGDSRRVASSSTRALSCTPRQPDAHSDRGPAFAMTPMYTNLGIPCSRRPPRPCSPRVAF